MAAPRVQHFVEDGESLYQWVQWEKEYSLLQYLPWPWVTFRVSILGHWAGVFTTAELASGKSLVSVLHCSPLHMGWFNLCPNWKMLETHISELNQGFYNRSRTCFCYTIQMDSWKEVKEPEQPTSWTLVAGIVHEQIPHEQINLIKF
jgi:hypothetical protein